MPAPPPEIRDAAPEDAPAIGAILNRAIADTTASWTLSPKTDAEIADWLAARREAGWPVLVAAEPGGAALAYAALGPFRKGEGYAPVAEASVYVAEARRGAGVGRALMAELAGRAARSGRSALVAAIGADNAASLAFFARLGFREVGRLPGIGRKFGRALDLVLMQRDLTREPG